MAGLKFTDLFKCSLRCGHAHVRHITVDRVHIDLPRDRRMLQNSPKLRAKDQIAIWLVRIEQRLFADAVASEKEVFFRLIPDSKSKHTAEVLQTALAVFIVKTQNDLGIGFCVKFMPACLKIFPEILIIIDLAIENDPFCFVGVMDRLLAAGKVDETRRIARPTFSRTQNPSSSGPRWRIA